MKYRKLGKTGIMVSEVGFGTWAIGGPFFLGDIAQGWGKTDDSESVVALEAAFDSGVTFFDTADVYGAGHSEELLGKMFKENRDRIVIATKGGNRTINGKWAKDFSASYITHAIDDSLKRLQTDYIDVYLMHTPRDEKQFIQCLDTLETLEKIKSQGKIRSSGISVLDENQGVKMINNGLGDAIQVIHNILTPGPEKELFPLAKEQGIGIIARVPLASGFLTGKYTRETRFPENDFRSWSISPEEVVSRVEIVEQLKFLVKDGSRTMAQAALQYILSMDAVSTVIPGAKNTGQVGDNIRASDLGVLSECDIKRIQDVVSKRV